MTADTVQIGGHAFGVVLPSSPPPPQAMQPTSPEVSMSDDIAILTVMSLA